MFVPAGVGSLTPCWASDWRLASRSKKHSTPSRTLEKHNVSCLFTTLARVFSFLVIPTKSSTLLFSPPVEYSLLSQAVKDGEGRWGREQAAQGRAGQQPGRRQERSPGQTGSCVSRHHLWDKRSLLLREERRQSKNAAPMSRMAI